jgi:hypothetical protein
MAASRPDLSCTPIFVFLGNRDVAGVLRRSQLRIGAKIERATNVRGISKNISQKSELRRRAIRNLGGRIGGSHRLEGGGDRVRLSRQLERDAIEAGLVDPWKRTNANDRLSAKMPPSEPQRAAGRSTRRTERSRTACTSLAAPPA